MNLFVGNLAFEAKEADLCQLFMPLGEIAHVSIVMDKNGKRSRGFAFLEMPDEVQAKAAIEALHGQVFMGRPINVEPAVSTGPKEEISAPKPEANRSMPAPEAGDRSKTGFSAYKEGRRSRSFMRKRIEAGITEPMPERKIKDNPMRWRKKKPWKKPEGAPPTAWKKTGAKGYAKKKKKY